LFKLLLQRGELGEGRIGIRLLVAAVGTAAKWPGVILLPFRALHAFATLAARSLATRILPINTLALPLHPLLSLVTLVTFSAVRPVAVIMTRTPRTP
jgi:hypothetical protein